MISLSRDLLQLVASTKLSHVVFGLLLVATASVAISQQPIGLPAVSPTAEPAKPASNTPKSDATAVSLYAAKSGKSGSQARVGAAGEMIGFTNSDASGSQTITLVHTGKSWMAVYHIDRSGTIRLVSSRPIDADFSLQLNATSPLPSEIREMGGKSR